MRYILCLTLLLMGVPQATSIIEETAKRCAASSRFVKLPKEARQFHHVPQGSVQYYHPMWRYQTFRGLMQNKGTRDSFLSNFFLKELQIFAPISSRYLNDGAENFPLHLGMLGDQALLSINVTEFSDDLSQLRDYQEKAHNAFVRRYLLTKSTQPHNSVYGLDLSITSQSLKEQRCYHSSLRSAKYPGGVNYTHKTIGPETARQYGDWGVLLRSSSLTPSHVRLLISDPSLSEDFFNRYFAINPVTDEINTNKN